MYDIIKGYLLFFDFLHPVQKAAVCKSESEKVVFQ